MVKHSDHTIAVVIPTLNEESTIEKILDDLQKQTIFVKQIIVVDGGSDDKTCLIAKRHPNTTLIKTKPGTAHQRNTGAQKSDCTHILFLDADVRLNTTFIAQLLNHFHTNNYSIVCPWYIPLNGSVSSKLIMTFFSFIFWATQKIQPSGAGPCILVKKDLFQKIKGFDDTITHDDIHFIRRAAKVGKFSIAPVICNISDRRFKKEGSLHIFLTYLKLGYYFLFNNFHSANDVSYDMSIDRYRKKG